MKILIICSLFFATANSFAASVKCEQAIAEIASTSTATATATVYGLEVGNKDRDDDSDRRISVAQIELDRAIQNAKYVCK